jgi:hypothetical protein
MTAVGKILVFVNLVFSLIVGAFVIMLYIARTHWVDEFNKARDRIQVQAASIDAFREEAQRGVAAADARTAEALARAKKAEDERDFQATLVKEKDGQVQQLKTRGTAGEALTTANQVESQRRQADTEKLRDTLNKEQNENARLVKETNTMRERAVAAEIQFKTAAERADRMEKELQRLAQDNARLKANLGGGAVARGGPNQKNPPAENVEGLIKAIDAASGLVTITIGTDAGVTKGNTMEVFRIGAVPSQSKYLGTIRIIEAGHNYAVGQPVGRMVGQPQPGDRVASRILGS